jgi:hypothetical protein
MPVERPPRRAHGRPCLPAGRHEGPGGRPPRSVGGATAAWGVASRAAVSPAGRHKGPGGGTASPASGLHGGHAVGSLRAP